MECGQQRHFIAGIITTRWPCTILSTRATRINKITVLKATKKTSLPTDRVRLLSTRKVDTNICVFQTIWILVVIGKLISGLKRPSLLTISIISLSARLKRGLKLKDRSVKKLKGRKSLAVDGRKGKGCELFPVNCVQYSELTDGFWAERTLHQTDPLEDSV